MEYNPEYWQFSGDTRHRMMPAFGALVMADYRSFLESTEITESVSPDRARSTAADQLKIGFDIDELLMNYGFRLPQGSEQRNVINAIFATVEDVITAERVHAKRQPLYDFEMTPEQQSWMEDAVFYQYAPADDRRSLHLGKSFISETRLSGVQGIKYFATALTLDRSRKRQGKKYDADQLFQALLSDGFNTDLRSAAAAPQFHWSTPDSDKPMWDILARVATKLTSQYFVDGQDSVSQIEFRRNRITQRSLDEAVDKMHDRTRQAHINETDPDFFSEWSEASSSGCPVRHATLGPNVQAAFTDEQKDHIATVADIDRNGVLSYTWDPFKATIDLVVPQIELVYGYLNGTPARRPDAF